MNFRKLLVAGALSCSLAVSGFAALPLIQHASAVEFSDTQGMQTEVSINKIVSLGVMKNPGGEFLPDEALTRTEFAYMVNQVASLSAGKNVGFGDLSSKNSNYTNLLKLVNNGYLTVSKGKVSPSKGVTNAEMGKFMAQSLGLKKSWTNRPIDYLFYLVRKDILDIDTDLDAVVTREEAAIAFDKFITLKNTFKIHKGIVTAVTDKGFSVNEGSETTSLTNASNISVFVSGQATQAEDIQVGSPATVYLNKKGHVAFYAGEFLDAEDGPITIKSDKVEIGTAKLVKDVNLDAFVAPLPNRANGTFTIKEMDDYSKNGATFEGQAFYTSAGEVTAFYPYISKVTDKAITVSGKSVTVELAEEIAETFNTADEVKVTLDGKDTTLDKLTGKLSATFAADKFGNITTISATTVK